MAHENYIEKRGFGTWTVYTYNPEKEFGPFSGHLMVSRDFHVIYAGFDESTGFGTGCIASFPSPNVAAAINEIQQNKN